MDRFNEKWIIYETYSGSTMYGTNTLESDVDKRGVCIPPLGVLLNPFSNFEQYITTKNEDRTIYNLNKFFKLASDCNPNIIELLFPNDCTIFTSEPWKKIVDNIHLFLSQRARHTFTGYAQSQMKRIKLHRGWLLNPPKKKPERSDYGLNEMPEFGYEKLMNFIHAPEGTIKDEWKDYAHRELSYRNAKEDWDKWDNWNNTRNPARHKLEEQFGYDTKHALHLFRLLSEGRELLETGFITLPRPDRTFLLEIKKGFYKYDDLVELIDTDIKDIMDNVNSRLPKKPDIKKLENLYMEVISGD